MHKVTIIEEDLVSMVDFEVIETNTGGVDVEVFKTENEEISM